MRSTSIPGIVLRLNADAQILFLGMRLGVAGSGIVKLSGIIF
jgi:hypothetical protein